MLAGGGFIPTGQLLLIPGPPGAAGPPGPPGPGIQITGTVTTAGQLPLTGNALNDMWIVTSTGHLWTWTTSGWSDLGPFEGPPGAAGPPGAPGAAATVTVGTTTTGAAGTSASVTNVGDSTAAILNFTIPAGPQGPPGSGGNGGSGGPTSFSQLTSGTASSSQAFVVGATASMVASGGGVISANQLNGQTIPLNAAILASNASGQLIAGSAPSASFSTLTGGTATSVSFVMGAAASLTPSGGTINANQLNSAAVPTNAAVLGSNASGQLIAGSAGGNPSFSVVTSGTSTGQSLVVGSGSSLSPSGGTVNANQFNGAAAPVNAAVLGTNASGQLIVGSGGPGGGYDYSWTQGTLANGYNLSGLGVLSFQDSTTVNPFSLYSANDNLNLESNNAAAWVWSQQRIRVSRNASNTLPTSWVNLQLLLSQASTDLGLYMGTDQTANSGIIQAGTSTSLSRVLHLNPQGGNIGVQLGLRPAGMTPNVALDVFGTVACTQLNFPDGSFLTSANGLGGGASSFAQLTGGTATGQAFVLGSNASMTPSSGGVISANQLNGMALPLNSQFVGTNTNGQLVAATPPAQTPWLSDIDGDGFNLMNVGELSTQYLTVCNTSIGRQLTVDSSGVLQIDGSVNIPAGQTYRIGGVPLVPGGGGGGGTPATIALRSSSNVPAGLVANTTIPAPSSIVNGDCLVIFFLVTGDAGNNFGNGEGVAPNATPPSGFTQASGSFPGYMSNGSLTPGVPRSVTANIYVWFKFASSESGNYTVTHPLTGSEAWMGVYSGVDPTAPFTPPPTVATQDFSGTSVAPSLTTSRNGTQIIFWSTDWGDASNQRVPPSGTTPTFTTLFDSGPTFMASGVMATAGPTGNATITNNSLPDRGDNSGAGWAAGLVALMPALIGDGGGDGGGPSGSFGSITSGTATGQMFVMGGGSSLTPSGGIISANQVNGAGLPVTAGVVGTNSAGQIVAGSVSSMAFSALTGGTASGQSFLVGAGGSLNPTGGGVVNANQLNGAAAPISAAVLGTNASGQLVVGSASGGMEYTWTQDTYANRNSLYDIVFLRFANTGQSGTVGSVMFAGPNANVNAFTITPSDSNTLITLGGRTDISFLSSSVAANFAGCQLRLENDGNNCLFLAWDNSTKYGMIQAGYQSMGGVGAPPPSGNTWPLHLNPAGGNVGVNLLNRPNPQGGMTANVALDVYGTIWCSQLSFADGTSQITAGGAGGGASSFSELAGGTASSSQAFLVGNTASLGPTGTGVVNANQINGLAVPASAAVVGTNSSGQIVSASTINATQINGASIPASTAVLATNSSGQIIAGSSSGGGTGDMSYAAWTDNPNAAFFGIFNLQYIGMQYSSARTPFWFTTNNSNNNLVVSNNDATAIVDLQSPIRVTNITFSGDNSVLSSAAGAGAGPQGPQGPSGTIDIGTVTTGAPGTPVTVTNSGTSTAAVFNFSIPQGQPGTGGGGGGGTGTVAVRASTSVPWNSVSGSTVITAPGSIQDGDLLVIVAQILSLGANAPTLTAPFGFQTVSATFPAEVTGSGVDSAVYVWYKVAGSESGNYTITHSDPSQTSTAAYMAVLSGVYITAPFNPAPTWNFQLYMDTTTATGLTTAVNGTFLLFISADGNGGGTRTSPGSPFSTVMDSGGLYAAVGTLASAGPTGNITITNSNQGGMGAGGALIAIVPGAGGGGNDGSGGPTSFDQITSGTASGEAFVVGSSASLVPASGGVISANQVNGAAVPASAAMLTTNSSGQLVAASPGGGGPYTTWTQNTNAAFYQLNNVSVLSLAGNSARTPFTFTGDSSSNALTITCADPNSFFGVNGPISIFSRDVSGSIDQYYNAHYRVTNGTGVAGCFIGYFNNLASTFIQSGDYNTTMQPLHLNPNGGNVGINLASRQSGLTPTYTLDVNGTVNCTQIRFAGDGSTLSSTSGLGGGGGLIGGGTLTGNLDADNHDIVNASTFSTVDGGGIYNLNYLGIAHDQTHTAWWVTTAPDNNNINWACDDTNATFTIVRRTGIGTTTPSHLLELSQDDAAKPNSQLWTQTSDIRTKQNVRPYEGGLSVINQLKPIESEYNGKANTPAGTRVVSFDPAELRKVIPGCVRSHRGKIDDMETDVLDMNLHELLFHLVLAVQQLAEDKPKKKDTKWRI